MEQEAITSEEMAEREAELADLESLLIPAVAMDNGTFRVVSADYAAGVVTVEIGGACSSCALSGATLSEGVERVLKSSLSWITEVRGQVDQSGPFVEGAGGWKPISEA